MCCGRLVANDGFWNAVRDGNVGSVIEVKFVGVIMDSLRLRLDSPCRCFGVMCQLRMVDDAFAL